MKRLFLMMVLFWSLCARAETTLPFLETVRPSTNGSAVVLVGGAWDNYRILEGYISRAMQMDTGIYGYQGNSTSRRSPLDLDYMPDNAKMLRESLDALAANGIHQVTLIGVCIGGLVAMRSVQLEGAQFDRLRLVVISVPFGGFAASISAYYTPGAKQLMRWLSFAESADLAPVSEFMQALSEGMPPEVESISLEGEGDPVTTPGLEVTWERYEKNRRGIREHYRFQSDGSHMKALRPEDLESQGLDFNGLVFGKQ